jgi:chromosome partitioning protein
MTTEPVVPLASGDADASSDAAVSDGSNPVDAMSDELAAADEAAFSESSARDFRVPPALKEHGPAKVIAMCNQKGGVGKTTSTINLGAAMADYGRRVLLIDLDPQGALSVGFGVPIYTIDKTVYEVLMGEATAQEAILHTAVPGLDLMPSNIGLSAAEIALVNEVGREYVLQGAIRTVADQYDIILIDCQPSLGLLTVNALAAADSVIIPLECEYFALRGVALLQQTIEKVKGRINQDLYIEGLLPTKYDARTVHTREVLGRVREAFGDQVFDTTISRTIKFPETSAAGLPITAYAPTSMAAQQYKRLAREVLSR